MEEKGTSKHLAWRKYNCWEVTLCGREPGGKRANELGVCPAAMDKSYNGINSGKCGGRFCWAVAGTLCGGCTQGDFSEKRSDCLDCDFYRMVQEEEEADGPKTRFLQYINPEVHKSLFEKMTLIRIRAGERFVEQGAMEETAYIIQRGACLVIVEKDGELHPVNHYGEGDIVGGLGILTGEPRRAHVEAETDMVLWEITRAQFSEVADKDPEILNFITEIVADRLDSRRPTAYRTIGKYVTTDIIGRGAFSIVYRGRHKALGMPVVVKMMRHDMALYPDFLKNFRNEAKIIAGLNHPHIVTVFDFEERFKTLFIIMEHVPGQSLHQMTRRLKRLPPQLAVVFIHQICSALDYAHGQGIVHRDINPSNIIVTPSDQIKILDFGLACAAGTEDFANTGTAHYMAPEQICGDPVDARTDIYALGITAYEMITGNLPFSGDNLSALQVLHLKENIPDPGEMVKDLPENLRAFILKAGRCDPEQRYQNAEQAAAALRHPLNHDSRAHYETVKEKRKISKMVLFYSENHQSQLNRLLEEFSTRVEKLGVEVKLTDFRDY